LGSKPFIENYQWEPKRGVKFILVDRASGKVTKFATNETYFAFHHINAFEQHGRIMVDVAVYKDARLIDQLYLDKLLSDTPHIDGSYLRRFTLDMFKNSVSSEQIGDTPIELPRINYGAYNTQPYRFAYGASFNKDGDFLNQLVKTDIEKKQSVTWYREGLYPGEPVFIAKPDGTEEDDGVILSVALDAKQEKSVLLILNARDFTEMGRAMLPHHIPFGFHGNFYR
jgi:carotenoid cleavage dioxygenase-like enzyme